MQSLVARASAEYFSVPRSSAPRQPIIPRSATEASASSSAVWTEESSEKLRKVLTTHWKIEKKLVKKSNGKELFAKVSEDLRKLGVRMNPDQCRKRWYRHLRDLPEWKNTFDFSLNSGFNNHTEKSSARPSSSPTREGSVTGSAGEGVKRFTYSEEQKRVLTAEGKKSLFPSPARREALATQLKLPVKMISVSGSLITKSMSQSKRYETWSQPKHRIDICEADALLEMVCDVSSRIPWV